MPADYEKIRAENITRYGTDTAVLDLLGQLYSDRTHFIFELIQNAEDAGARELAFELFDDRLEVRHDGRPFTDADVRGICGVGNSAKAGDLTAIGRFGIGFKSVYAYTQTPSVHSPGEHFRIESYVRPVAIAPAGAPGETLFIFPFDRGDLSPAAATAEIAAALAGLGLGTLLFLRSIERVTVGGHQVPAAVLERAVTAQPGRGARPWSAPRRGVTLRRSRDGATQEWLVWHRDLVTADQPGQRVEIAFPVRQGIDGPGLVPCRESPLVVFFPTEKETFLGFLIQGPYRTTPARDNVPEHDPWNQFLVGETAALLAAVLTDLRDDGLLTADVLGGLPLAAERFGPGSMLRGLFDSAREALAGGQLIPVTGGGYGRAGELALAAGAGLRELLSPGQLGALDGAGRPAPSCTSPLLPTGRLPSGGTCARRSASPRSRRNPSWPALTPGSWRRSQMRGSGASTPSCISSWPCGERRTIPARNPARPGRSRSSGWRTAARYRPSTRTAARPPTCRSRAGLPESGGLPDPADLLGPAGTGPPGLRGLPGTAGTGLPTVRRAIARFADARNFLTALQLGEPDAVAEVLGNVLPRYAGLDVAQLDAAQHEADLERVARALAEAPPGGRDRLRQRLSETAFLVGENAASGEERLLTPASLYQRSRELESYFDGNPDAWFARDGYGPWLAQLREMGVRDAVAVHARTPDSHGHVVIAEEFARHERGLHGFDPDAAIEGLEFALNHPGLSRSEYIWNLLLAPSIHLLAGVVEHSVRLEFADASREEMKSPAGAAATAAAWLPGPDGAFHRPAELELDDLPPEFRRDDALAAALGMIQPVVAEASRQLGLPPGLLRGLSAHPDLVAMVERELKARAASGGHGPEPTLAGADSDDLAGGPLAAWLRDT